jgi:hypothetical protein
LTEWPTLAERRDNLPELVRNLIYSSLVLFYNMLYLAQIYTRDPTLTKEWLDNLIHVICTRIIPHFGDDILITPILLEFINLFTKEPLTCQ